MKLDGTKERVLSFLEKEEVQQVLKIASTGVSLGQPAVGGILQAFGSVFSIADEIKVQNILKGLLSGLNPETYLNEIKAYVNSSEENAIRFVDMLRKAMLADSEIVCVLIGRILADHINNKVFDRDDLIVIHSLESASDFDLIEFREMVQNHENGYIFEYEKYMECVDWCLSNRLCKEEDFEKDEEGVTSFYHCIYLKGAAYRLKEYLDEIKQIFR